MVTGYHLKDQKEWEKVRLLAFFTSNTPFMKHSIRSLDKIIKLELIDGKTNDRVEKNIEYLLDLKRKAEEKRKAKEAPAAAN